MQPGKLLRPLLAASALTLGAGALVACGDSPTLKTGPSPTPAVDKSATCGPSTSKIASIQRTGGHSFKKPPDMLIDSSKNYTAVIKTDKGNMTFDLAAKDAPNTVNNFVFLACDGFYDGLLFHRVVEPGGQTVPLVQSGDPRADGSGGPGYIFDDEFSPNIRFDAPGIIGMANAGAGTNGSQFFITRTGNAALNDKYSAFGKLTDGRDVLDKLVKFDKIIGVSITEK